MSLLSSQHQSADNFDINIVNAIVNLIVNIIVNQWGDLLRLDADYLRCSLKELANSVIRSHLYI